MTPLILTLRFLRQHAVIRHADDYEPYESLDSLTQGNWLAEAIAEVDATGGYVLPARFTRGLDPLVLLIERPTQTIEGNQNV
jgi:hypothetical protein